VANVTLWRPFHELERWRREMDREFGRHFASMFHDIEPEEFATPYLPAIESYVKDGNLVVRIDVPGLEPKDIELSVLGNTHYKGRAQATTGGQERGIHQA
jgi:HSP20 family protein